MMSHIWICRTYKYRSCHKYEYRLCHTYEYTSCHNGSCHTYEYTLYHTYEWDYVTHMHLNHVTRMNMRLCFSVLLIKQTHFLTFNSSIQYLKLLSSIFLYVSLWCAVSKVNFFSKVSSLLNLLCTHFLTFKFFDSVP